MVKIALISGSLRKDSLSTKIAKNVGKLFPSGYDAQFVEIGNLPMYNEDIDTETNTPAEYTAFRNPLKKVMRYFLSLLSIIVLSPVP